MRRYPVLVKSTVSHDNKLLRRGKDAETQPSEPDRFLEVVRLMKEEIMETLNKRISSMENHLQHLQQTLPTQTHQFPMSTVSMARPNFPIPQQTIQFQ